MEKEKFSLTAFDKIWFPLRRLTNSPKDHFSPKPIPQFSWIHLLWPTVITFRPDVKFEWLTCHTSASLNMSSDVNALRHTINSLLTIFVVI